jgi:CubicO group peptidase (beta-lactamase class C family)
VEKIDELMERYKEFGAFNGCLLVIENGKVIYKDVHGIASIETGESLTVEHRFRLASVSKQFTAMAVMVLEEKGKLDYDDDVRKYIPELPYERITIRHLLTHSSGLPSYTALLDEYWDPEHKGSEERKVASNSDALAYLVKYKPPLKFKPGAMHRYCNTGYNLLALIVERISGMRFQDFMKEHIFAPVGMDDSFVNDPSGVLPEEKRAHGFKPKPDRTGFETKDFHYQNGMYGDGGIFTTIEDMLKWDQALRTERLVSSASLEEAFSPSRLNDGSSVDYGFGWSIIDTDVGRVVAHGGGWLGFSAFILRDLEHGNTVIQLCNMPGIHKGELAFAVFNILHGKEYKLPRRSIAEVLFIELHHNDIQEVVSLYRELKAQHPEKYIFDEQELNGLGHRLLSMERTTDAIEILKLNVEAYPESWNAYDSLGETFMKNGDREEAIKNYQKSLDLNPKNENARVMIEKLKAL